MTTHCTHSLHVTVLRAWRAGRSRRTAATFAFLLTLAFAAAPKASRAQGTSPRATAGAASAVHSVPVPSIHAIRRTSPVTLDGRLDEPAWQGAPIASDFRQIDPNEGALATQRTEVRFLVDDDALYVGAKLFDTEGARGVRPQLARRDNAYDADWFELGFDTFHDHVRRFFMSVTPSGAKNDEIGVGSSCCDPGWDPVWEVATHIDEDGWSAEFRIPFSQIRIPSDSIQTWGLQLKRVASRLNETSLWAFWRRNEPGGAPRYGHLEGLRVAVQPRHLEVMPYAVAREKSLASEAADPFANGAQRAARVGADIKYLLTPNLTLAATINPDFGQVEVDPAAINLSAFETFFTEKRPFFIEGVGAFRFGRTICDFCSNFQGIESFYSRRIGRAPTATSLAYAAGPYVDVPEASTILGAAKVTGRTKQGITVGLLDAVTRREVARVQRADGTRTSVAVEPPTNYFVGRLTSDRRGGSLVTGVYASSVVRSLSSELAPFFNQHSEMAGADVESYWKDRTYSLLASAMVSNVSGDPSVITARQRSSARYFQRPDGSHRVDTLASSMRGAGAYLRIAKDAGDWTWEAAMNTRTPGYEVNDIAFQARADFLWFIGNISRLYNVPTALYRRLNLTAGGQYQRNYQGLSVPGQQVHLAFDALTPQFWAIHGFAVVRPSTLDDRLLRGGPAVSVPSTRDFRLGVASDARRRMNANVAVGLRRSESGQNFESYSGTINARVRPNVIIAAGPSVSHERDALQYVTSVADPSAATFDGRRYVLADIRETTVTMDTRLSVTLRPTMSFEAYAQPLMAAAAYRNFKEYRTPRMSALAIFGKDAGTVTANRAAGNTGPIASYTIDADAAGPAQPFTVENPDFTTRSLRGNAVFRWEYRPGSTLYFAWTQSRSSSAIDGNFDFTRDGRALLSAQPDNIFLVKASWWWAR